jgi:hypothetical protein
VLLFREGAAVDVGLEFLEGRDAFQLQPVVFRREIAIDLGVARNMPAIVAQNIAGK